MATNVAALNWAEHSDTLEFSSAEILACFTTPLTLVEAPGAGKFIEFISLTLAYDYGATAYTLNGMSSWRVRPDGVNQNLSFSVSPTGFIDQTSDQVRVTVLDPDDYTPEINTALVLLTLTANPTLGDGVIHAQVIYRVIETGL